MSRSFLDLDSVGLKEAQESVVKVGLELCDDSRWLHARCQLGHRASTIPNSQATLRNKTTFFRSPSLSVISLYCFPTLCPPDPLYLPELEGGKNDDGSHKTEKGKWGGG